MPAFNGLCSVGKVEYQCIVVLTVGLDVGVPDQAATGGAGLPERLVYLFGHYESCVFPVTVRLLKGINEVDYIIDTHFPGFSGFGS